LIPTELDYIKELWHSGVPQVGNQKVASDYDGLLQRCVYAIATTDTTCGVTDVFLKDFSK
jgi:hypothetical protein